MNASCIIVPSLCLADYNTCSTYLPHIYSFIKDCNERMLRPRPHVSGDFCIRKFFYADTPSVHTCPPYTLGVSGDFCIRCVSGYVWTLVSVYFCIR